MVEEKLLKSGIIFFFVLLVLAVFQLPLVGRIVSPGTATPCGDGYCDFYSGEDMATCSEDCSALCGDGICSPGEYRCIESSERICEKDCGRCPPGLTGDSFIPMCIGDLKRYEEWCWLDEDVVIVDPMLKGARDYGEATVVTWVKNSGGEDLLRLNHSIICDHDYEGLESYFDGNSDVLKRGGAIPLVIRFGQLDKVGKDIYHCIVRVVAEEPRQVFERELIVRFV